MGDLHQLLLSEVMDALRAEGQVARPGGAMCVLRAAVLQLWLSGVMGALRAGSGRQAWWGNVCAESSCAPAVAQWGDGGAESAGRLQGLVG